MLRKLLFGAGAAYLARRFMGGRRDSRMGSARPTGGMPFGLGGSRFSRRSGW